MNSARPIKTVFVSGDFFVLHPGHIRFLKFASACGEKLYIGINNNQPTESHPSPPERLEAIKSLSPELGEHAFIITTNIKETIEQLKPDLIVKGNERKNLINPESDWIKPWGGEIIFSSGESNYFEEYPSSLGPLYRGINWINPKDYIKRHLCERKILENILSDFNSLKIIVVGDTIIDEYIQCDALGMSREEPSIVISPISTKRFLGGAAIVAAHAKALGGDVSFFSVIGTDGISNYSKELLNQYQVNSHLVSDHSRPTTLKQRFRVGDKTMSRINHLRHHEISQDIEDELFQAISNLMDKAHVLIFSDFNYGCLTQSLVNRITEIARKFNVVIGADSQSSSQFGDISRYKNSTLLTPTEHEARIALRDNSNGLAHIGKSLLSKTNGQNAIVTLGGSGVLVVTGKGDENSEFLTDILPALNPKPVDVSGAGDSLLIVACMALACSATPYQAAYLGSLASGIQVSRIGNIPIKTKDLICSLDELL